MGNSQTIYQAAEDGHLRRLQMRIRRYPRSSRRVLVSLRSHGHTPLTVACGNGHVDVVEYLIDECGVDIEQRVQVDQTVAGPLWWATHGGHLNVVKSLLSRGADINSNTPLIEACIQGDLEIVKFLVDSGANVGLIGHDGLNAVDWAREKRHLDISFYLISHICYLSEKDSYPKRLSVSDQTEVDTMWEELGATKPMSSTPLAHLTHRDICSLTDMLVIMLSDNLQVAHEVVIALFAVANNEIGAEMRRLNQNPEAERDAVQFDRVLEAVIRLIFCFVHLERQGFVSPKQVGGFRHAVHRLNRLDPRDTRSWNLLHMLCHRNPDQFDPLTTDSFIEAFEMLLDAFADPTAVDADGNGPLHHLAMSATVKYGVIDLLLNRGALKDAVNGQGKCFFELLPEPELRRYRSWGRLSWTPTTVDDHDDVPCEVGVPILKSVVK